MGLKEIVIKILGGKQNDGSSEHVYTIFLIKPKWMLKSLTDGQAARNPRHISQRDILKIFSEIFVPVYEVTCVETPKTLTEQPSNQ